MKVRSRRQPGSADARHRCAGARDITAPDEHRVQMEKGGMHPLAMVENERASRERVSTHIDYGPRSRGADRRPRPCRDVHPRVTPRWHIPSSRGSRVSAEGAARAERWFQSYRA